MVMNDREIVHTAMNEHNSMYTNIYSDIDAIECITMKKPLVVMMGIGYYLPGGVWEHLIGVPTDYKNMIKLFALHWGYPLIYQTDDNKIVYLDKQRLLKNNNKYHTNFKLKWNDDEISGFVLKSKKIIATIKPDGLIFVISSHGDRFKVLIDSNFKKYRLKSIFSEYWNSKDGCPYLADKPKIFFLDMCRGQKTPLPMGLTQKINTKGKNVNNNSTQDKEDKVEDIPTEDENKTVTSSHIGFNIENINGKNDENNTKIDEMKEKNVGGMENEYLEYENFCVIYGNLEDYSVLDGGKDGGFLIRALKNVLKQRDSCHFQLNQLIRMIGQETLRLVKGEKKKDEEDFQPSKNPTRQIIESHSSIMGYVFFGKMSQHQFTVDSQFRYNKYLDFQRKQLNVSFKNGNSRPQNRYVCLATFFFFLVFVDIFVC